MLATLVDSHSNICVPGFYDDAATTLLDAAWKGMESSEEFSPEGYQARPSVSDVWWRLMSVWLVVGAGDSRTDGFQF